MPISMRAAAAALMLVSLTSRSDAQLQFPPPNQLPPERISKPCVFELGKNRKGGFTFVVWGYQRLTHETPYGGPGQSNGTVDGYFDVPVKDIDLSHGTAQAQVFPVGQTLAIETGSENSPLVGKDFYVSNVVVADVTASTPQLPAGTRMLRVKVRIAFQGLVTAKGPILSQLAYVIYLATGQSAAAAPDPLPQQDCGF